MLSSICVAVITGLPAWLHWRMMFFWIRGTFSGGISTPRSPRATMMPSAASRMPGKLSTASGFSILAMTLRSDFSRMRISLRPRMSSGRRTKERAMYSMSWPRQNLRSSRSFSVRAATLISTPGRLIPLRSLRVPPLTTRQRTSSSALVRTSSSSRPSSSRMRAPVPTSLGRLA